MRKQKTLQNLWHRISKSFTVSLLSDSVISKKSRVQSACFDIKKKCQSVTELSALNFFSFSSVARRTHCVTCRTTVEMAVMNKDAVSSLFTSYSQSIKYELVQDYNCLKHVILPFFLLLRYLYWDSHYTRGYWQHNVNRTWWCSQRNCRKFMKLHCNKIFLNSCNFFLWTKNV